MTATQFSSQPMDTPDVPQAQANFSTSDQEAAYNFVLSLGPKFLHSESFTGLLPPHASISSEPHSPTSSTSQGNKEMSELDEDVDEDSLESMERVHVDEALVSSTNVFSNNITSTPVSLQVQALMSQGVTGVTT
ncbi:hypothetical protein BDQ12DRAFT_726128 [Crucibulum laeve]|uniref:Uncharacterized protein n=1 Tax=Crucibulum laeve TaxID=68775 RepID=A0A5C3LQP6_9AGAR|nr:hypothetical protein BDQ12DRAFT_726128 [Crucibulum laeve]